MKPQTTLLLSAAAVVGFDAVASFAALIFGFPYANAALGSLAIYAISGFIAARVKSRSFSVLLGALIGFVDATAGWGVAWIIGPGRLPSGTLTAMQWVISTSSVVVLAALCAGAGGLLGWFGRRHTTTT